MLLLDGKVVRGERVAGLRRDIRELGFSPTLAIVQVGDLERSRAYVSAKRRFAESLGIPVELSGFTVGTALDDILYEIQRLNNDPSITGILVQLPLPKGLDRRAIIEAIEPSKDVDGLTASNLKSLLENDHRGFVPATARGILSLLDHYDIALEGKNVVVVGRSLLVGKAAALAFLNRNATVTICHRATRDLPEITKRADILVVAAGKPRLIGKGHVAPGQVVIDVGINVSDNEHLDEEVSVSRLVGDVDFDAVKPVVGAISPVPGGVGPMTVLSLFENLVEAARRQARAGSH